MEAVFESIRLEEYGNAVIVYNSELHTKRLFKSVQELGFKNSYHGKDDVRIQSLFFQNQIKNFVQYHFNKAMSFRENTIPDPFKEAPTHQVYKLRFVYFEDGKIEINLEEYTRDLTKDWQVRVIDPGEFHINSEDLQWKHKLYSRENIPVSAEWQEQIWVNEKNAICEGSFTNIFWQGEDETWYTPSLETNILAGTMRELVLGALQAKEVSYTIHDLKQAKTILLTNAMIGVKPVILSESEGSQS